MFIGIPMTDILNTSHGSQQSPVEPSVYEVPTEELLLANIVAFAVNPAEPQERVSAATILSNYEDRPKPASKIRLYGTTVLTGVVSVAAFGLALVKEGLPRLDHDTVNTSVLPNHLPPAVKRMLPDIFAVMVQDYDSNMQDDDGGTAISWTGSGIMLTPELGLSAGHMFDLGTSNTAGQSIPIRGIDQCNTVSDYTVNGMDQVHKIVSSFVGDDTGNIPDVALLSTNADKPTTHLAPVTISRNLVKIGEPQIAANFEPLPDGEVRFPTIKNGKYHSPVPGTPAVYPGVVTSLYSNGDFEVTTGYKSYYANNKNSKFGASGGAEFNLKGQLDGITVQVATSGNGKILDKTIVQPINQALIGRLESKMSDTRSCQGDA